MSERETRETDAGREKISTGAGKKIGIYLGVLLVVFLLGLVPMWLKGRTAASERDVAQRELLLSRMQNALASATIDAQRGEYEAARQETSEFFTSLRGQLDNTDQSALAAAQRTGVSSLLTQRDELITLLARSDPASASRLLELYVAYRKTMSA